MDGSQAGDVDHGDKIIKRMRDRRDQKRTGPDHQRAQIQTNYKRGQPVTRVDPMAEGSISEFTLWLGPIPIHWRAVHSQVSKSGFTDTQEKGPMAFWAHKHRFEALSETKTRIHEQVEYTHPAGLRGLYTRLLFGKLGLLFLFNYRKFATKRTLLEQIYKT